MCLVAITKAAISRTRWRDRTRAAVDARARAMAPQMQRLLMRVGARELERTLHVRRGTVALAKGSESGASSRETEQSARYFDAADPLEVELLELLMRYGVRQFSEAADSAAAATGGTWRLPPSLMGDIAEEKQNKVILIMESTTWEVREAIKRLVVEAERESPRPSSSELARRIARTWFGPPSDISPGRGTAEEARVTADWRRTQRDIEGGSRESLFSFERSYVIARTELQQVEVAGAARGYTDSGVEVVGWLAFPNDGRSGRREHWRMNGETITVAAMNGKDSSQWFELPSGIRCPYPGWIGLPASDAVSCRCGLAPA